MPSVKSTYNFVPAPAEEKVYKPCWANQVSHDVPFSDGESGEIRLTLKAETPIFVRNGHVKGQKENEFSHLTVGSEKAYFIPATSLKGMIRNVLEMMSRGRMSRVNDHHHAVRQIMRQKGVVVDEGYELSGEEKRNIYCGWLVQQGEEYFIVNCGKPLKIRYTDLDQRLDTAFGDQFGEMIASNMDEDFSARTAKYKYENVIDGAKLVHRFEDHPLDEEGQDSWVSIYQPLNYVRFSEDELDSFVGTIVCVGQASKYSVNTSRRGEYVFAGDKIDLIKSGRKRLKVAEETMAVFRFINRDNTSEELEDWAYWKGQIKTGIPVFFRKTQNGKGVKDMGLSFMYKQPAKHSVKQSYPIATYPSELDNDYRPDLAETMFGYAYKKKSLKGRIFIGNAFQHGAVQLLNEISVVQSSPKSSFFPFYMKQNGRNGQTHEYNTYNLNPTLSGYKRYPVRDRVLHKSLTDVKEDQISRFIPLDKGAEFTTKIRFHNLRKVEVGALISALTFHGEADKYFHQLGYAKSYGYGKLQLGIELRSLKYEQDEYLKVYEYELTRANRNWYQSELASELLSMASSRLMASNLDYMDLKDFQKIKNKGYYLEPYSVLSKNKAGFKKHLSDAERAAWLKEEQLAAERLNSLLEEEQMKIESAAFNHAMTEGRLDVWETFLRSDPSSAYLKQAEEQILLIRQRQKKGIAEGAKSDRFETASDYFKDIRKWPAEKLKIKYFEFTDIQKKAIAEAIRRSYALENQQVKKSSFYKKKQLARLKDFPWSTILKWLGEDGVKELYKELTGRED